MLRFAPYFAEIPQVPYHRDDHIVGGDQKPRSLEARATAVAQINGWDVALPQEVKRDACPSEPTAIAVHVFQILIIEVALRRAQQRVRGKDEGIGRGQGDSWRFVGSNGSRTSIELKADWTHSSLPEQYPGDIQLSKTLPIPQAVTGELVYHNLPALSTRVAFRDTAI